ncbi:hypothetical protein SAMN05216361_1368 [Marisediminitalea aggregata]|uniref:Uncharacterized protein n=1 Tax=Marisediminitalea aggregata TaxID=634436 RepID=A0A1M5H9F4_9ALTE|nr:hypothetical protein [Marisediminitalea aggregata]SHG12571.1 hypothetical protein SAMN05216361_1368 [Marisediminitalea aggregata]
MKHIKQWPEHIDLGLPSPSHKGLIALLTEPFSTTQEAAEFWLEYCRELLIIESESELVSEYELIQLCLERPCNSHTTFQFKSGWGHHFLLHHIILPTNTDYCVLSMPSLNYFVLFVNLPSCEFSIITKLTQRG